MITIPAVILNSFDRNKRIFTTAEAVAPRIMKSREKPTENKIVWIKKILLYSTS